MEKYDDLFEKEYRSNNKLTNQISFTRKLSALNIRLKNASEASEIRKIYTEILLDEDCHNLLLAISAEPYFLRDFSEFYVRNKYNENLLNCTQNSKYHRYSVFKHTLVTIEEVGKNNKFYNDYERSILKWAMLLHDLGKPYVKVRDEEGNESFKDHDRISLKLAKPILERLNFEELDIKLILALIEYHDKYLNEGEVTYDNLKKLSEDLGGTRENFSLIISVKDADNSAKSIDVYNEYKVTREKYVQFLNDNFREAVISSGKDSYGYEEILEEKEYRQLIDKVIDEKIIEYTYQPIFDAVNSKIMGYEMFSNIRYNKKVNIMRLIDYAKGKDIYNRLEQSLFINALEAYDSNLKKVNGTTIFINMDFQSYIKYVNKARLYEYINKNKIAIDINSYDKYDIIKFEKVVENVHKNNGEICLDGYIPSKLNIESLKHVDCDYIKIDRSLIRDIDKNEEKQKVISDVMVMSLASNIKVIAVGIETMEEYNTLRKLDVRYFQGYYLARPSKDIVKITGDMLKILNDRSSDSIV